jgi:peptidyl-prolyl cis-trans isomerase SurA
MHKRKQWVWAFLLWGLGFGTGWAQSPNRIVAVVNDQIITLHELEKSLKQIAPDLAEKAGDPEIRRQLLARLIDQKLIDMQVKRLGIQITEEEVDKAVERIKEEQGLTAAGEFVRALQKEGLTEADFRNRIREQLLRYRLVSREIGSRIIIPEDRLRDFFEKNKSKYQKQEGIHLALIFLSTDGLGDEEIKSKRKKMEEIRERLLKGEDFAELAKQYSQDPSASTGGDLGVFDPSELDPNLREALAGLQAGQITPVLQTSRGLQLIKVVEIIGNKDVDFKQVRERVYNDLFQEEVDKRFAEWLEKIRERSHIQVLL